MPKSAQKYIVGYARRSSDEKDKQIMSIEDQITDIKKFYSSLKTDFPHCSFELLKESRSAYKPENRPEFSEILAMIERGEVEALVVVDATRISRNPQDSGAFIQLLATAKLPKVYTINNNACYTRQDTNQLFMLMLETAMSWKYSADNGGKVSSALQKKIERGEVIGRAPLGYVNRGEKGETYVEFDDERKPIVEKVFALAATGVYSIDKIAEIANKSGLRTRPRRNRATGEKIPPQPVSKNSIHNMLKNPFYKGCLKYKGEVCKGVHEPLVEPSVWEKVQLSLSERYRAAPKSKKDYLQDLFVMRGVVHCADCEKSFSFYRSKGGRYVYGDCKGCGARVRQEELLEQLYEKIDVLRMEDDSEALLRRELSKAHEKELSRERSQRKALEAEYNALQDEVANLFSQRQEAEKQGMLDAVDARLATMKMRRDELQEKIQNLHEESNEWIDHVIECFELVKLAKQAIKYGSPEMRQSMLKTLASNYVIKDEKLEWKLKSPFREVSETSDCTIWGEQWFLVRTETTETFKVLQVAFALLKHPA